MRRLILPCALVSALACATEPAAGGDSHDAASESEDGGETGEGELLRGEPSIVLHDNQPMVADVFVELAEPGVGELVHASDDDVRVFLLDPGEGEAATNLHFRVRGLLPATEHPLRLEVSAVSGEGQAREDSWEGAVLTNPPLPGFIPKFEIESLGNQVVEPIWRLFDMNELFSTEPSGVFMVDDEGTTRWYIGDVDDYTDLHDIHQGVRLRPDGRVSFTRRDECLIVDELGEVHMRVSDDALGANGGFHHELIELPSGNFLVLGYSFADVDYEGEGALHIAGDKIFEFTPEGELVWTWDTLDHFDPQRRRDGFFNPMKIPNPELGVDAYDWTHGNGLTYTAADDVVYLSTRHQDWITAIDHATGEVLWNLGDEGDFELVGDEFWFFHQHSPQWQPDGSLLLYDNAVGNPERPDGEAHSRALRYVLDLDAMTATLVWQDDDPFFTSPIAGDADRTPGGHVLRLDSRYASEDSLLPRARLRELDPARSPNAVWTLYMPPNKFSYRATVVDRFVGVPAGD